MVRDTTTSCPFGSNAPFPSDPDSTVTGAAEMLRRLLAQVHTERPGGAGRSVTDPHLVKEVSKKGGPRG
ncbi:hypothetical protein GCM10010106_15620 [Thermopolyspora flexuosa]|nr:hypothetical protein GCM10010106_15620 [Thermopolyspora flexuosa]